MNLLISTISIIILVLEGAELLQNSSQSLLTAAGVVGLLYVVGNLSWKVINGDSSKPEPKAEKEPDTRPKCLKYLGLGTGTEESKEAKPSIPYKDYSYPNDRNLEHLNFQVEYWLPNDEKLKFAVLSSRDVKPPEDFDVDIREYRRAIERAGGYTNLNALATILSLDDKKSTSMLPDDCKMLFVRNGSVDIAANNLIHSISQYLGKEPFYVMHY